MHAIAVSRVSKRALDFMEYNYDALLLRRFHCQNNRGHRCDATVKLSRSSETWSAIISQLVSGVKAVHYVCWVIGKAVR